MGLHMLIVNPTRLQGSSRDSTCFGLLYDLIDDVTLTRVTHSLNRPRQP